MRALLLTWCLLLAPVAQAQVIECPKFYPWQDTVLAEVPHGHKGRGLVTKQELSGASWMGGEFNDTFGEMEGGVEKVKGGLNVVVPAFARWFVCWYGRGRTVAWWEELNLDRSKTKNCKIQIQDKVGRDPMDIKLICK